MKELLLMYARYTKRANADVIKLLDVLSNEARNEDRKSYYKSLSGLALHIVGATLFFQGMFRAAAPKATEALAGLENLKLPKGPSLTQPEWSELKRVSALVDDAIVAFVESASDDDLASPVKWFGGKPETVPLCFMAHSLFTHGTHHRGQVSQILDSMGVDHDFSGLDVEFLPTTPRA